MPEFNFNEKMVRVQNVAPDVSLAELNNKIGTYFSGNKEEAGFPNEWRWGAGSGESMLRLAPGASMMLPRGVASEVERHTRDMGLAWACIPQDATELEELHVMHTVLVSCERHYVLCGTEMLPKLKTRHGLDTEADERLFKASHGSYWINHERAELIRARKEEIEDMIRVAEAEEAGDGKSTQKVVGAGGGDISPTA